MFLTLEDLKDELEEGEEAVQRDLELKTNTSFKGRFSFSFTSSSSTSSPSPSNPLHCQGGRHEQGTRTHHLPDTVTAGALRGERAPKMTVPGEWREMVLYSRP